MVESRGDRPCRDRSDRLDCPGIAQLLKRYLKAIGNALSPHPSSLCESLSSALNLLK
ncbi:hypothetical protein J0895_05815 [Phormidium pseudopriestleyi FRX01]|uniref:Uncharacterized protein n=1 Tax=Phormidium pseudopriestleyi FRX01 TaxID=1759528 RepID=A0ABS3FPS5_9CYAN|nr:hypothetical protein [Phormidium pseudopriestleyi]MBO0348626.1 hypothetical protein [Phormidium pseudopriestleyi FRX01]